MWRYLALRIAQAAVTLLLVSVAIFLLTHTLGDPVQHLLPPGAPRSQYIQLRHVYGYDRPLLEQYRTFMLGALTLNFGMSTTYGIPAGQLLLSRLPVTVVLAGGALVVGMLVGIPLGLLAGYHPNSIVDRGALILATAGQAIPIFVIALGLIYLFAVHWQLLPAGGNEGWTSFVLPVAVIALWVLSTLVRLTRSNVREVLEQPYILLARAKGLTEFQVILRHALRNTLAPVLTFAGLQLGIMLSGTVVTETVFALPGVGAATLEAVAERDFNVIQTAVMMFALTFVSITLLVDMLHVALDPRVSLSGKR